MIVGAVKRDWSLMLLARRAERSSSVFDRGRAIEACFLRRQFMPPTVLVHRRATDRRRGLRWPIIRDHG